MTLTLFAQISPGDLTEAHKHLEGISNCTECHELGKEPTNKKCLVCHDDIALSLLNNSGYHSTEEVKTKKCYRCHSEHHGRNFEIIRFNRDEFDHSRTGFVLTGKHVEIECEDCHKTEFIQDEKHKAMDGTFFGLSQNCIACHEDYHQATLGNECQSCHTTASFSPASKFDHDTAEFKLTGAHKKVECNSCHKTEIRKDRQYTVFTGLQFERCINCHADFHNGKFGSNCESCHTVQSFKEIKNVNRFDHSKTNFPLVGQHQFVECMECHKTSLSSKPKHEKCVDCHSDFHGGEFKTNGTTTDCSVCHREDGFLPSTFTLALHQKSDFPLTGSHLAVPCTFCHRIEDSYQFRFESHNCINCHDNIHKYKISRKFLNEEFCQECHTTESWRQVNFDHSRTDFDLSGKHSQISCSDCHFIGEGKERTQKFKDLSSSCESCHKDIHLNQFRANRKTDCARCHAFENWKPVKFNHAKTDFALDGKHADINCEKCHKEIETPVGKCVKYKFEEIKCINCHSS